MFGGPAVSGSLIGGGFVILLQILLLLGREIFIGPAAIGGGITPEFSRRLARVVLMLWPPVNHASNIQSYGRESWRSRGRGGHASLPRDISVRRAQSRFAGRQPWGGRQ